ncbi:signal transduction histidine kinase/CheY-like chemotaxis protein/HPt (histidine-containing phosphotransfer) domain-containing protein [Duganella sp. SG902]|uniref:ATP-binding protein n=1 Tax=Duganella sp. SG902 TaxID=2587016 RepID=UPI00159D3B60|nr:signal transduction histidine kinase/CheY-like chemotaxis protein/HPt (histidine-containing phosphotransfer) domain-containing protein [Duganella sp. SG902]
MSRDGLPRGAWRAALYRRMQARAQGEHDLQDWRSRLLDGLCAVAFWFGLLAVLPSMWGSVRQGHWPLALADVAALAGTAVLHFRRGIPYRWRAGALLAIAYLIAVVLLFSLGPLSQIYLLAVPVLCTVLIGAGAATLALLGCGATLFLAGYLGGIEPGMAVVSLSPLAHWAILSLNFLLVAAVLSVSCTYLLHGLAGALVRERAIHARNAEALAARRAAEVSSQLKSDFLAMISHEVRTPLGGVIGMLRSALKDSGLAPHTHDKLRLSLSNAEVLLQIINDILDFSRLEAGKMPLETLDFDLATLLRDVVDLLADRAEAKGISLIAELDPALPAWWRGDPTRLRQVVVNLVGNGIKFTEHGEVRVSVAEQAGQGIVLSVRDSGIGIAPEALGRLFQKFEQADAATARKYGGTGLGLAICKNIVAAMGGHIEASSEPGVGSVFRVRLPLARGTPAPARPAAPLRPHAARLAVLCAEDGSTNQIILRELLGEMGHLITLVEDGVAALEELAARDYDLVILDGRMPRMDGLAALQRLRAGLDGVRDAALPVIALTANATAEDRQRFLAAGASGFLAKPIDEHELHAEIARQLAALQARGRPLIGELRAAQGQRPALAELDAMFGVAPPPPAGVPQPQANDKLYRAMRAAFLGEGPRLLEVARQGLAAGDAGAVALAAHSLMGAAAYLGADAVHTRCARIEKLADAGQLDAVAPQLAALGQELEQALAGLQLI